MQNTMGVIHNDWLELEPPLAKQLKLDTNCPFEHDKNTVQILIYC